MAKVTNKKTKKQVNNKKAPVYVSLEDVLNESGKIVSSITDELNKLSTSNGGVAYNTSGSDIVDLVFLNKRLNPQDEINTQTISEYTSDTLIQDDALDNNDYDDYDDDDYDYENENNVNRNESDLKDRIKNTIDRMLNEENVSKKEAFHNRILALALLLQNYDIKGGMGERYSSLFIAKNLLKDDYIKSIFPAIVPLILKHSGYRNLMALYSEPANSVLLMNNDVSKSDEQLEEQAGNEFDQLNKNVVIDSRTANIKYISNKKDFVKNKISEYKRNTYSLSLNPSMLDIRSRVAILNEFIKNEQQFLPNSLMYKWMFHPGSKNILKRYGLNRFLADINQAGLKYYHNKDYRKWLSDHRKNSNLNLLETKLTNKDYTGLDISKLPKRAIKKYLNFFKNKTPEAYEKYIKQLETDNKENHTINLAECLHGFLYADSEDDKKFYAKQYFNAIRNMQGKSYLPIIDVSGSMQSPISSYSNITMHTVALAMGIAFAITNTGSFKNKALVFSSDTALVSLTNKDIINDTLDEQVKFLKHATDEIHKIGSYFAGNTNLASAYDKVLSLYEKDKKSSKLEGLVVLSDGQYDPYYYIAKNGQESSAKDITEAYKKQFKTKGFNMPVVVYWNLNNSNGIQVSNFLNQKGVLALSGYNVRLINALYEIDDIKDLTSQQIAVSMLLPYYNEIIDAISKYDVKAQFEYVKNNINVFKTKYADRNVSITNINKKDKQKQEKKENKAQADQEPKQEPKKLRKK